MFEDACILAERSGDEQELAFLHWAMGGVVAVNRGDVGRYLELSARAVRLADETRDLGLRLAMRCGRNYSLYLAGLVKEDNELNEPILSAKPTSFRLRKSLVIVIADGGRIHRSLDWIFPLFSSSLVELNAPALPDWPPQRLSFTERRNRVLERPHAGVPQGCGRRIEAAKLAGERADALVKTVGLPRLPRKVLELVCADVAELFSVIRAEKPALVDSDGVGGRSLIRAVCCGNRINCRAARLKPDGLCRSAVVGQSVSRKQRIDTVAIMG